MKASAKLDRILNLLLLAEEINGKAEVLPAKLAEQLGDLIEAIEDECYFKSLEEEDTEYA